MRISLIQTTLHWEQPARNRAHLAERLRPLAGTTDLIVLPEMFTTGFSMNAEALAEPTDGPTVQWLHQQATHTGALVMGSFICREGDGYYNRLVWRAPDGSGGHYDKRHLFSLAKENLTYTAGDQQVIFEWMGWRIRPLVCYDLRFPVWSRQPNDPAEHYDLLIYVANWPQRRSHHWRSLLTARAIENQSFTIGVNIVGQDGNGLEYSGDSTVTDFAGQAIAHAAMTEQTITVQLDAEAQKNYRQQFLFLRDADIFQLKL